MEIVCKIYMFVLQCFCDKPLTISPDVLWQIYTWFKLFRGHTSRAQSKFINCRCCPYMPRINLRHKQKVISKIHPFMIRRNKTYAWSYDKLESRWLINHIQNQMQGKEVARKFQMLYWHVSACLIEQYMLTS